MNPLFHSTEEPSIRGVSSACMLISALAKGSSSGVNTLPTARASSSVSAKDALLMLETAGYKWPLHGISYPEGKPDEEGVRGEHQDPELVEDGVEFEEAIERCSFIFEAVLEKVKGNACEIREPKLEVVLVLH